MRDIMSNSYVEGFVATCEEQGLSKAAAALLLQRQSLLETSEDLPGFMDGYMKVAATVPGHTVPRVTDGFFEKPASIGSSLVKGLKFLGKNRAVQAGGLLGGGILAGKALTQPARDAPYLPSGGYNPEESAKIRKAQEASTSEGVYDLNRQINQSSARRKVLDDAVNAHDVNSGKAQQELWKMDRDSKAGEKARDKFRGNLDATTSDYQGRLADLEDQRNAIQSQRTSIWRAPLRWLGLENQSTYDNRALKVEDQASRIAQNLRLNERSNNLLNNGVTSTSPDAPAVMPKPFFPTN